MHFLRPTVEIALACFLIIFGCGLLTAGFCVSPTGEIHGSVLTAFGEICTLAGAILGINYAAARKTLKIQQDLEERIVKQFNENGKESE